MGIDGTTSAILDVNAGRKSPEMAVNSIGCHGHLDVTLQPAPYLWHLPSMSCGQLEKSRDFA